MQVELSNLNVLADPSLSIPISKLARLFSSKYNIAITTSYASARDQSDNIVAGLEADVFITARKKTLDTLETQGLIDVYSQTVIARNRISMVTYADNQLNLILIPKLPLSSILKTVDPEFTFTIGNPDFQNAGLYGLKALRNYEMASDLEPNFLFVRSPIDTHRTISQKGGYGVIYHSEAVRNPGLKILGTFPEVAHSPILYYGVVVAGENMDAARKFLDFLTTSEAQNVFAAYGFESTESYTSESGHLARGSMSKESSKPL